MSCIEVYILIIFTVILRNFIIKIFVTIFSPCNLGMLWEITDGDCDKLTARFMSEWIPSEKKEPWSSVDLTKWESGNLGWYIFFLQNKSPFNFYYYLFTYF